MLDIYAQRRIEIIAEENLPCWPASDREFEIVGAMRSNRIDQPPLLLRSLHIQEIRAVAAGFPGPGGFRCVYLLTNKDFSLFRLGAGLPNRLVIHASAYLVNITPEFVNFHRKTKPNFWRQEKPVFDMIHANGGRIGYIVLADRLSEQQAKMGEKALFKLFPRGSLINGINR